MNRLMENMARRLLQLLIIASVFAMFSFVFADEVIELEYGNEAYEEFLSYKLEEGYVYEVSDDRILEIRENVLYANRFGDAKLIVNDLNGKFIKEIAVIVYFVGNELTPFSAATINQPYLSGYPDGSFKPKNYMTRAELAAILSELMPLQSNKDNIFIDLNDTHWAKQYLMKAVENGFLDPITEDEVSPEAYITKKMMAQVVYKYSEYNQLEIMVDELTLVDTKDPIIYHAINSGAMRVFSNDFESERFLKREEVVRIINYMTCRKVEIAPQFFLDVDFTNPYNLDIQASAK